MKKLLLTPFFAILFFMAFSQEKPKKSLPAKKTSPTQKINKNSIPAESPKTNAAMYGEKPKAAKQSLPALADIDPAVEAKKQE